MALVSSTINCRALRCRLRRIARTPPVAEPPPRFQQEHHAEK
jgi:hypothetical protein